ncbi:MAG: hypothetical protein SV253_09820 [Halobacteria archaeon]|nr:hypothetical protein [Halobacteria archaeon]
MGGNVQTFSGTDGGFEILDIAVTEGASIVNNTVKEVSFPEGTRIIADLTNRELVSESTEFKPDNRYLIAVETGQMEDMRMLFQE